MSQETWIPFTNKEPKNLTFRNLKNNLNHHPDIVRSRNQRSTVLQKLENFVWSPRISLNFGTPNDLKSNNFPDILWTTPLFSYLLQLDHSVKWQCSVFPLQTDFLLISEIWRIWPSLVCKIPFPSDMRISGLKKFEKKSFSCPVWKYFLHLWKIF